MPILLVKVSDPVYLCASKEMLGYGEPAYCAKAWSRKFTQWVKEEVVERVGKIILLISQS